MEVCSIHDDSCREVDVFKWLESERIGYDIGIENAIRLWIRQHWKGYLRAKLLEHLLGYKYWAELDRGDFGLLQNAFQDHALLLDRIIDRLRDNQENLEIINWAIDWNICCEDVLRILADLDINSRRISPRFEL